MTANIIYVNALIDYCIVTYGIALTGKVIQRFAENKENKNEETK
jgi:hypothetical protein